MARSTIDTASEQTNRHRRRNDAGPVVKFGAVARVSRLARRLRRSAAVHSAEHRVRLPILQSSATAESRLEPLLDPKEVAPVGPPPVGTGALRTSSYTIFADLPDSDGAVLLVHGYSGAITRVSSSVASYLHSRGDARRRNTNVHASAEAPPDGVIDQLIRRGYLTRTTEDEELAYFATVANKLHVARRRERPNFVLLLTYDCNLRCSYCFQNDLRSGPGKLSTLEQSADAAMVDRWFRAMNNIGVAHGGSPTDGLRLTLYGGEPLLARNRPLIEDILRRAGAYAGSTLSAVTNGTEVHAVADLIGPDRISLIQVTLDGPKSVHDQRRIWADGSGSFDQTTRAIDVALERGASVDVRINVCNDNVHSLPDLAAEFDRRGWFATSRFTPYVAAVHKSTSAVKSERPMNSWQLKKALADMGSRDPRVARIGDQDYGIAGSVQMLLGGSNPLSVCNTSYCGAQTKMYVFDRTGDIYACWERTGDPNARIGRIDESGDVLISDRNHAMWRGRNITTNETCVRCAYATFCGGGCAAIAEEKTGNMLSPYCDGFQQRFRKTAAEVYAKHVAGASIEEEKQRAAVC